MTYPKITIVTPSYNQAEFIEETILSVISQNYPNLEYIIIDGASTDGSVDIIKKYEKHLSYWISEPDSGHADALNKGFARSTGEIMAWINSDDKYFPWTFNTIAEVYSQNPDILWTTGLHANFDRKGVLMAGTSNVRAVYKNVYSYLFKEMHIQQESVFWRRNLWEKSGGYIDEKVHLMVDTELWCRFFLGAELWHIDQVIGGYRTYGLNRSHTEQHLLHVKQDIDNSVDRLYKNISPEIKTILDGILKFRIDFHEHHKIIGEVSSKIRKRKLLQWLPYLFYERICNHLYRRAILKKDLPFPEKPIHPTMVIKKVERIGDSWIKSEIPWDFSY